MWSRESLELELELELPRLVGPSSSHGLLTHQDFPINLQMKMVGWTLSSSTQTIVGTRTALD